jgi:hypothetical protein
MGTRKRVQEQPPECGQWKCGILRPGSWLFGSDGSRVSASKTFDPVTKTRPSTSVSLTQSLSGAALVPAQLSQAVVRPRIPIPVGYSCWLCDILNLVARRTP